jgi:hypothetical protein
MNKWLLFLAIIVTLSSARSAEVRLRSAAVCSGTVARVADVAEVFAADDRVARALAEIPLCPSPAVGQTRVVSQEVIRQLLDLSGVERTTASVTGSETVTISRQTSLRASPAAKLPLVVGGIRQAAFEVEAEMPAHLKPAQPATLQPSAADQAKPIKTAPLIEKGASLTVHARTAGVRITAAGKAIDSGGLDESIGVELIDTKQRVVGRIVGPQTVEITTETSSRK